MCSFMFCAGVVFRAGVILLYYILPYTILFCSSVYTLLLFCSISSSLPPLLFIFFSSYLLFLSSFLSSIIPSQPFYTCRYFHLLIYIPSSFPFQSRYLSILKGITHLSISFILYLSGVTYTYLYSSDLSNLSSSNLTPHVLSEWMVEVCGKYLYVCRF